MVLSEFVGAFAGGSSVNIIIRAIDEFSGVFSKANKQTAALGTAITAFGVLGAGAIAMVVNQAAKFEQTQTAFTTMLGSEEKALKTLKELTDFAARTPFTIPGVEKAAKQLLAVGFEAEELIPTLKSVGDVASGLGVGEEGLERLILNLGQVKTQGKLTGRELRDFAVNGVPLLDELAKSMGKTKEEISEMVSKGEIGFNDVADAFNNMSGEGGKFFNLMDAQSKTFLGQISNITDSFIKIARIMGDVFLPAAKLVAEQLQKLIGFMEEHPKLTEFAAVLLGVATAAFLIIGPIVFLIAILPLLIGGFGALSTVSLPLIGTILLIGLAIVSIIALFLWWEEVILWVGKVLIGAAGVIDKYAHIIKDSFIISFTYMGNVIKNIWNGIVSIIEGAINVIIDKINNLIEWANENVPFFNIPLVPDMDLSGFKAELTDMNKLMDDLAKQREEREKDFNAASDVALKRLQDKYGQEQKITEEIGKQSEETKKLTELQQKAIDAGLKFVPKTGDVFNPKSFSKSEFESDFAYEQAKLIAQSSNEKFIINIETVQGLDPEEISKALSNELSKKISL
jgi:tape measure domain-containing protein